MEIKFPKTKDKSEIFFRFTNVVISHESYSVLFKCTHAIYLPSRFQQVTEEIEKLSLDSSK